MIRVLGDRVLVALPPKEHEQESTTGYTYQAGDTTASGIILAKSADVYNVDLATRGIVMALGEKIGQVDVQDVRAEVNEWFKNMIISPGWEGIRDEVNRVLMSLAPAPFDVQVGDCVIFAASSGEEIMDDGIAYVILHEHEIIGVVEEKKEAA